MKLIAHYNDKSTEFDIVLGDSWFGIKMKIVKEFSVPGGYVDLEFANPRPIREFGKQALLLGVMERVYDDFYVGDFIINTNRELIFKIHPVDVSKDNTIYLDHKKKKHCVFDETDFPSLKSTKETTVTTSTKTTDTPAPSSSTKTAESTELTEPTETAQSTNAREKKPVVNAWTKKLNF